jgi:predicted ATPase
MHVKPKVPHVSPPLLFAQLTEGEAPVKAAVVPVMMGRELEVPQAAGRVCMFGFQELCGRPLAAADYLALTGIYHTMALSGVPVFKAANRSEGYRFVTLIDVFYEHRSVIPCWTCRCIMLMAIL